MKSIETADQLELTAKALLAPGKGILAADESFGTIEKRFKQLKIPSTEENRQAYRDMLFTTPGLSEFVSGVILFDETLRQNSRSGAPFPHQLWQAGIIPGIKVDKGAKDLAFFPEEKITEGLDGLRERFAEYSKLGARFSKWRAVITITPGLPTQFCIDANAQALARFAALSQEAGLLPIVEPEVLRDGHHTLEQCYDATVATLRSLFDALAEHRVRFEELLLKASMVTPGKDAPPASVSEVAEATLHCLRQTVPATVPGVVFLSGGQSEQEATAHLNAINQAGPHPWEVSFSFSRALQSSAMESWHGNDIEAGQKALYKRARLASAARNGKYSESMESEPESIPELTMA